MPVRVCTGFEFGTTAGFITGNAGNRIFDIGAAPTITSTGAVRTGTYCLELSPSGTTEWVGWNSAGAIGASQTRAVLSMWIRFPTSLPSNDCIIAVVEPASTGFFALQFRNSDDKLVINPDGGTLVAGPTVVADTWYHVELYTTCNANPYTCDWWIDGAAQTQATVALAASTYSRIFLGDDASQTMVCRYDDLVLWTDTAAITTPVGPHKVEILNVDTGTAYVLNGTAANWSTFTANGTIDSSFTVTEARDRTDEWPPTIGASADGLIQDANSTTDNVEIAMTSYTLQAGELIAGVRMLACGWAVSTTGATFGFRSYNGTTETILQAGTVDPNFDNSTTAPAWVCKMLTLADVDTQSELDGLRFRVGFSSDAAPDIGIHAIAAEVAIKESSGSTGTVAVTLADFTSTATGSTTNGTSAQTLANFTSTASGTVTAPPITGTSAQTLADFTSTASGKLGYSGTSAQTLANATAAASGQLGYSGTSAQTLADFTSTASGTVAGAGIAGSAAAVLADATSVATGVVITSVHTETFNKADGALGPDFAPYDEIGATAVDAAIVSNRVRFTAPGQTTDLTDFWVPTLPFAATNDIQVSVDIPTINIGSGAGYAHGAGVAVRAAEVSGPDLRGYYAEFHRSDVFGDLYWLVLIELHADGTFTAIDTDLKSVASVTLPATVTLTVVGTRIQASVSHSGSGSTFFCEATDATFTAGTVAIVGRVDNGATSEGHTEIDNFVVRLIGHVGTSAQTLGNHTSAAAGQLGYSGSSAQTLASFTPTASGQLGSTGTSAQTLQDFTSTASGTVSAGAAFTGSAAVTLDDFASSASATTGPSGTVAAVLDDFTSTASGTVPVPPITGTLDVTLDDLILDTGGRYERRSQRMPRRMYRVVRGPY